MLRFMGFDEAWWGKLCTRWNLDAMMTGLTFEGHGCFKRNESRTRNGEMIPRRRLRPEDAKDDHS